MIIASEARTNTINAQEIMRLEKIKKEIERKERFDQMVLETIKFCDTDLSIIISKDSIKGNNMVVLQWGEDTNNEFKSVYRPLKEEENRYANGDSSFTLCEKRIHVPTMIEYLIANGYTVKQYDWSYMCYGCGSQRGTRIYIQWES